MAAEQHIENRHKEQVFQCLLLLSQIWFRQMEMGPLLYFQKYSILTVLPPPSNAPRQEEGSGTVRWWVGPMWLTHRHWPVLQPDKLTVRLNWPCGTTLRQPNGKLPPDARWQPQTGQPWKRKNAVHTWAQMEPLRAPAEHQHRCSQSGPIK